MESDLKFSPIIHRLQSTGAVLASTAIAAVAPSLAMTLPDVAHAETTLDITAAPQPVSSNNEPLSSDHRAERVARVAIRIDNNAGISTGAIQQFEHAITVQSRQLRQSWQTPIVKFTSGGGWHIDLFRIQKGVPLQESNIGYHSVDNHNHPYAHVTTGIPKLRWTAIASHEIMEMLVDPNGNGKYGKWKKEVCDPVRDEHYWLDHTRVADFVTRTWFLGGTGPYDFMERLTQPGATTYGFATTSNGIHLGHRYKPGGY